jgi:hypothetical protein
VRRTLDAGRVIFDDVFGGVREVMTLRSRRHT